MAQVYRTVLPGRCAVGDERLVGADLHVVRSVIATVRIDDDMPSIEGSHLLGHEGEQGSRVEIEVRKTAQ
jgi:hypothetical protein